MTKNKGKEGESISFVGGQFGSYASNPSAMATDEMFQGMDLFRMAAEKHGAVPLAIRQGNLFEYIEAAKFNTEAVARNSGIRAHVTAAEGDPHSAADILLKNGEHVIREVQAKSSDSSTSLASYLKEEKYNDMMKLVPKDKAEHVKQISEGLAERHAHKNLPTAQGHADTAQNVTGELNYGDVRSGGTRYKESLFAAENPELYARVQELKAVVVETGTAGLQSAAAGAIIGGTISVIKNSIALSRGELTVKEAIQQSGKDTAKASLKSGTVGVAGTAVRVGAKEMGLQALSKSNVATAVAAGLIESGVNVYKYAKGEITVEEAVEEIGKSGVSTISSIYTGAAAGAVFGPAGLLVGSVAGYIVASNLYQSGIAIFRDAKLAKEESARVVALCEAACEAMAQQRMEFEKFTANRIAQRKKEFEGCFRKIDEHILSENYTEANLALANFAVMFGKKILFEDFISFDRFMIEDRPLIL